MPLTDNVCSVCRMAMDDDVSPDIPHRPIREKRYDNDGDISLVPPAFIAGLAVAAVFAAWASHGLEQRGRDSAASLACQTRGFQRGEYSARTDWKIVCYDGQVSELK